MAPFPLALSELLGQWGAYAIFLLIGFGFGFVLEMSGFGNARKLAAQFYFKDMTVFKVMFGVYEDLATGKFMDVGEDQA